MRARAILLIAVGAVALASPAWAQQPSTPITPPANPVLSNVNGVPIGPFGGLEGGAYVARVDDPSASWFNPAGLSRATSSQISGNAGLYQFTSVVPTVLPDKGGGLQQLPNLVGYVAGTSAGCTFGFAFLTTNSWQQETNSQLITGTAASGERFGYSADAEFSRRYFTVSSGCRRGRWRLGGGLAFALTSLSLIDTASDRVSSSSGLSTALISSRRSGSAFQLRPVLGAQFDPAPAWKVGVVVRTPGWTLHRSGVYAADGTINVGTATQGVSFFDADARFTDRLPWEIQGGVGYIAKRAQVEVDVQAFSGGSAYAVLASDQPIVIYSANGPTTPVITTQTFAGAMSSPRAIANVTIGGHYQILEHHSYLLHGGFTTDQSPVKPEDQIFDQVNLLGWTVGMSGQVAKLRFSAGVNIRRGHADDVVVRNLLTGELVTTTVKVRTTAFIYSVAYEF
ncbi:MAG TPA: hypothetical protein VJN96_02535 [Vicinamibacterales bacterium]|nr:hypothetical protein [Vicinamibacterales bacterium]